MLIAGSGKTFLVKHLTHKLRNHPQGNKVVLLTATTGAAAIRLSVHAQTAHHTFDLPARRGQYLPPGLAPDHPLFVILLAADVIVIDEMSMLKGAMLDHIMFRLAQVAYTNMRGDEDDEPMERVLRTKCILLVGDLQQLPPVCYCQRNHGNSSRATHRCDGTADRDARGQLPDYDSSDDEGVVEVCTRCHISASKHWSRRVQHDLTTSVRHASDKPFAAFLDHVRIARPTQELLDTTLLAHRVPLDANTTDTRGMCINPSDVASLITDETTVICSHRSDARSHNATALHTLFPDTASHIDLPLHLVGDMPESAYDDSLRRWLADKRFHTCPTLAIGAKVMITTNINLEHGLCNGAVGHVDSVKRDATGAVIAVYVKMLHSDRVHRVGRTVAKSEFRHRYTLIKTTFPLMLAWAVTAHRIQGATLSARTIVHVRSAFAPGMLYVALSRVTRRDLLYIVGTLRADQFTPLTLPSAATRTPTAA